MEITREIIIPVLQIASVCAVAFITSAKHAKLLAENSKLKEKLRLFTDMPLKLKDGIYYDKEGNAFCPACRGKNPPQFMPLLKFRTYDTYGEYKCPNCDKFLQTKPVHNFDPQV